MLTVWLVWQQNRLEFQAKQQLLMSKSKTTPKINNLLLKRVECVVNKPLFEVNRKYKIVRNYLNKILSTCKKWYKHRLLHFYNIRVICFVERGGLFQDAFVLNTIQSCGGSEYIHSTKLRIKERSVHSLHKKKKNILLETLRVNICQSATPKLWNYLSSKLCVF